MRSSLEQFEQVSDYVSGTMTDSQRSLFELEMSNDPFLQEQVAFQKDLVHVVERRALRGEIAAVAATYATGGMSLLAKLFLGTGGVLILTVVGYFYFTSVSKDNQRELKVQTLPESEIEITENSTPAAFLSDSVVESLNETVSEPSKPRDSFGFFKRSIDLGKVNTQQLLPLETVTQTELLPQEVHFTNRGFVSIPEDSIIQDMMEPLQHKRAYLGIWRSKPMQRGKASQIPGLKKVKSSKKAATVYLTDEEGNFIQDATITFSYFGDQRTVPINGVYMFDLYSNIKTNVMVTLGNSDQILIENVEFRPRYLTYLEIEGYTSSRMEEINKKIIQER